MSKWLHFFAVFFFAFLFFAFSFTNKTFALGEQCASIGGGVGIGLASYFGTCKNSCGAGERAFWNYRNGNPVCSNGEVCCGTYYDKCTDVGSACIGSGNSCPAGYHVNDVGPYDCGAFNPSNGNAYGPGGTCCQPACDLAGGTCVFGTCNGTPDNSLYCSFPTSCCIPPPACITNGGTCKSFPQTCGSLQTVPLDCGTQGDYCCMTACSVGACGSNCSNTNEKRYTGSAYLCGVSSTPSCVATASCACTANVNTNSACTVCANAPANTCGANNGTQTCYLHTANNGSSTCTVTPYGQSCQTDNCSNNYTCNAGSCRTSFTVHVFSDDNHNAVKDAGEAAYSGVTVSIPGQSGATDGNGNYTFTNLTTGTYTITLTKPADTVITLPVNASNTQNFTLNNNNGATTFTFGLSRYYSISGSIYNDINQSYKNSNLTQYYDNPPDTLINSGNVNITGTGVNLSLTPGNGITNGAYTSGVTLLSGTYTVSYPTLPQDYKRSYPGDPGQFSITIGQPGSTVPCNANSYVDASCDGSGNVGGLDFGLTNEITTTTYCGASVRSDIGFSDPLHQVVGSGATCGSSGVSSSYAYPKITNDTTCDVPGVVYSGATDPYYGQGQASPDPYNWQAGDGTYNETFGIVPNSCPTITTSYSYITGQIASRVQGNQYQNLSLYCDIYDCNLPQDLPNGLYQITPGATPMTLHAMNFPAGKNWVFLINGDLTIDGRVLVNSASTATFIVSGNITITGAVGNAALDNFDANIQGFYSTDGSVTVGSVAVDGNGACVSATGAARDKKLVTTDSVIVDAACKGGSLVNNRTLCVSDLTCSAIHMSIGKGNISGTLPEAGNGVNHLLNLFTVRPILQRRDFEQELTP